MTNSNGLTEKRELTLKEIRELFASAATPLTDNTEVDQQTLEEFYPKSKVDRHLGYETQEAVD